MPTRDVLPRFWRDWDRLTAQQQRQFLDALRTFVADLRAAEGFRPGLRVKGVQGAAGIFEMTWARDGRATFHYGDPVVEGETHIVWRRIGTHEIFGEP
jgi:hypothetical protein